MKKILKAIGIIIALMAIYFVAQGFVTMIIAMIHFFKEGMSSAMLGAQPDFEKIAEDLLNVVGAQTPWILLIAVVITLPTYYLFYRGRKQELLTFVSFRSIGVVSIPVLVIFGLSLNVIITMMLGIISQIDIFKQFFDSYSQLEGLIFNGSFVLSLLAVGIIGPIFEEILFRGLIFGHLRKITKVQVAIFIQAFLFGAYHMNVIQGTYAFLIGIILGFVYYRSNSIIPAMIIHITINASSVLLGEYMSEDMLTSWGGAIVIAGLGLFFLTGAFILISKSFRRSMDNSLFYSNRTPKLQPIGQSEAPEPDNNNNGE